MTSSLEQPGGDARSDWERRIYRRLEEPSQPALPIDLPAPAGLAAVPAVGHVRLSWTAVPDAAGYLIERADGAQSEPVLLSHGGSDVSAIPQCVFADTGLSDGVDYRYRVAATAGEGGATGEWSAPVTSRTRTGDAGTVTVSIDADTVVGRLDRVWHMVGSERLSQLCIDEVQNGHDIAQEFAAALQRAHDELGVDLVRAHAILHDDNQVARRELDGQLTFDFERIDAIYDRLLAMGIRPVVELSFMPAAMARDPQQTVFTYRGIISPPADWAQWRRLVTELAQHLVTRYGIDEVASWAFEVWNEPNLVVFWSGTKDEYLRLYDESARALQSVDPRLRIGGPATAASEWVHALVEHARRTGVPLDFVSTHTYGNHPLDFRPVLERAGMSDTQIWWTEWGVGHTHFGPIHDGVLGACFVLSGYAAAQGRLTALAYWVVSDHFEELGRPPRLFHNGFGLLSVGNLRKPRYWAAYLAAQQGDDILASRVEGDGADVLVQAWATRHGDGTVDVLVWNGTINAEVMHGDPRLDRAVRLSLQGLNAGAWRTAIARVDQHHSNIVARCPPDVDWPDDALWEQLRAHDQLHEERISDVVPIEGRADLEFALPMPGIVRVRLTPDGPPSGLVEKRQQ